MKSGSPHGSSVPYISNATVALSKNMSNKDNARSHTLRLAEKQVSRANNRKLVAINGRKNSVAIPSHEYSDRMTCVDPVKEPKGAADKDN